MNFKYFIIGIYLTFVAMIVMMVFKSCGQKIELETKNYYNEELKFQDQIDAKLAGNPYADSFAVNEKNGYIVVTHPSSVIADSIVLNFRKPDNAASDKSYKFIGNVVEPLKLSDFNKGFYDLKIRSYKSGKPLLVEKKIKI